MNILYETYTLNLLPYYYNNNYYHILSINKKPKGPLIDYVKLINIKNPSSKINKFYETTCLYCIKNNLLDSTNNNNNNIQICTKHDIHSVIDFLVNNNYIIDYQITDTLSNINSNKLLFYFKYKLTS